jgi:hyperosmotically inducible periplasmic protein
MRALSYILLFLLLLAPVFAADAVSDDELFDKVRIQLANDREVGGGNIQVQVSGGAVELTGKVKSEKIRARAEKLAKKVKGVKSVTNRLVVAPV